MESPKKMNIALKWGGIMGALLLVLNLLFYLTGMIDEETGESGILSTLLSYVISCGAVFMAIKEYKELNARNLSLGEATVVGLLTGIFGGLIMAVWTYFFFTMISPELLEGIKEQAMAQSSTGSEEQDEMVGSIMDAFMSPGSMSVMVVIMKFFLGLIFGFLTGLVMKEENVRSYSDEA